MGKASRAFPCGRSMAKLVTDLYRIPDKVKAVADRMLPEIIKGAIL